MRTPISYYGGKQNLAPEVISLFPEHIQYVEGFFGGGAVFFEKPKSFNEAINDLNGWVTNFFWVVQNKYKELEPMIRGALHSEIHHKRAADILKQGGGSDLETAWAFWVQTNMSFGNKIFSGFAFSEAGKPSKLTANKRNEFSVVDYCKRLERVEIFQRDAIDLIKLKDSVNTFFYLDPPYVSSDMGHYKGYTREDWVRLLETISQIKGKFLLSSYPEPELEIFIQQYNWNAKQLRKIVGIDGKREETKYKVECLTYNYEVPNKQIELF